VNTVRFKVDNFTDTLGITQNTQLWIEIDLYGTGAIGKREQIRTVVKSLFSENTVLPSGVILLWTGNNIPIGWALCDGTKGIPDLRDRFIVGAGNFYNIGDTGGNTEHTHGSGNYITPNHTHTINTHIGTPIYRGNNHYLGVTTDHHGGSWGDQYEKNRYGVPSETLTSSANGGNAILGTSGSVSALPPYYALAYIMKL